MTRSQRQIKILDIIDTYEVETQEDLVEILKKFGGNITQATISRDIKELGLIKVLSNNKYKYAFVETPDNKTSAKLINLFKEAVISVTHSLNLIVIKTLSGSANIAASLIDKLGIKSILGSIAGDDTILVIVTSIEEVPAIVAKLKSISE